MTDRKPKVRMPTHDQLFALDPIADGDPFEATEEVSGEEVTVTVDEPMRSAALDVVGFASVTRELVPLLRKLDRAGSLCISCAIDCPHYVDPTKVCSCGVKADIALLKGILGRVDDGGEG